MSIEAHEPSPGPDRSVLDAIERLTGVAPRIELRREVSGASHELAEPPSRAPSPRRGHYRMLGEIARGGMGVILRGRDQDLGRDIALKVLHTDLARRSDSVQRFIEEAQISGQLQHPGIVPVYELGLMADERPYFTMKLIRGRTFAELLLEREESTSDRRRMLDVFLDVCQTIAYAHSRGVVHRDLKPANVMVGSFGEVQVVDWGLAKVLGRSPSEHGRSSPSPPASRVAEPIVVDARDAHSVVGVVMGTLAYMPPEQARGDVDALDERADVFSLGAILCEILTGGPPYSGTGSQVAIDAARGELSYAFEELDRAVADRELVELCKQCLAPDRDARPRTAQEIVSRLQAHFETLERRARDAQVEAAEARVKAAEERRARRLTASLAASVVATMAVAGGAWAWMRSQREARETATREEVDAALLAGQDAQLAGDWPRAVAAIERAQTALAAGASSSALSTRVAAISQAIQRGAEEARVEREQRERNETLLRRFDEILARNGRRASTFNDFASRDTEFAEAFREWGVDVDEHEESAVIARIAASGAAVEIAGGLDQWTWNRVLALRGWKPQAERLARVAIGADPHPERVEIRRALMQRDSDRLSELARDATRTAVDPATALTLSIGLLGHGRLEDAYGVLAASVEHSPGEFALHYTLGLVLEDLGVERMHEARAHYLAALALQPRSSSALRGLASTYYETGDLERAEELFRRALEIDPLDVSALHGLAVCVDDPAEQETHLRRVLELAPDTAAALINLGRLLHNTERAAEALPMLERGVELVPDAAHAWGHLGQARSKTGDTDAAIAAYRKAVDLDPNDVASICNLAIDLRSLGKFEEALQHAEAAIRLAPGHPLTHGNLAAVLAQLGRDAEALEQCERAFAADPTGDPALIAALRVLVGASDERLRDPERALELVRRAFADGVGLRAHRVFAVVACAQAGRFDEALTQASQVDATSGLSQQIVELARAMALWGRGDEAGARAAYARVGPALDDERDPSATRLRDRLLAEVRALLGG